MIYKYVNVIILKCCLNKDFVRRTMNYDAHCYIIQTIMHINKILLDSIFNTVSLVFSFLIGLLVHSQNVSPPTKFL